MVSTRELSCFSLATPEHGLRVCSDSLCQRSQRSGAPLGRILMFLTDYLLKCLCPHLEFPVCVCTELHPGEKEKENTPRGLYCRVQPDGDQCLLSVAPKSAPSTQPGGSKRLPQAMSLMQSWGLEKANLDLTSVPRPSPKPEHIYQTDLKSRLTADGFSHMPPFRS